MNHVQSADASVEKSINTETSLLGLTIVVMRRRRMISTVTLAAGLIAAAISLCLPNVYKSSAKLLPPQQGQSSTAGLLSQLSGAAGLATGIGALKNPSELYVSMLKSRTVADRLIQRFDLKTVYDTDSLEKTRKKLENDSNISSGKDGLISIEVESHSQKLVAQIANGYIDELVRLTRVLAVTEASQRRVFFERQLEQAKNNLANAEVSLKKALDTRGVISVDSESRAVVETVGRLRAQISAKEIELSSMNAFLTSNNPEYKRTQEELTSLRAELAKLENGRGGPEKAQAGNQTGLENIKLLRDVKYYQMLYELLAKQYEAARLDEAKDGSLVQILDPAYEPEKKSKPYRALIVLVSTLFGFCLAVGWAILANAKQRMLSVPENSARWDELSAMLRVKKRGQ